MLRITIDGEKENNDDVDYDDDQDDQNDDDDDLDNAQLVHVRLWPCCQTKTAHLFFNIISLVIITIIIKVAIIII